MIEDKLSTEIIANRNTNGLTIVSVCGAADLGKSYLSNKTAESLAKQHLKTNHLTMDSYLMSREKRVEKGLSGYEIEAYNHAAILKDLIALKNRESIHFKSYDHRKGKSSSNSSKMNSPDILIFDGLHSMHATFVSYIDLTIFIYTDDALLKTIRSEADLIKRNYTSDFSKSISQSEFNLYKSNIEPYKKNADYVLYLKNKWNYQLK